MRLHEITDKNFNLKKAIIEKKVCPTEVIDVTVWENKNQLEIHMNPDLGRETFPKEAVVVFWDYFNKTSITVKAVEIHNGTICLKIDHSLLIRIQQLNAGSVRIAMAFCQKDKSFCGYFRNLAAKDEELTFSERLICKIPVGEDCKNIFAVYWTEGGILSGRFEKIDSLHNVYSNANITGYFWDNGMLNCYVETAAIAGEAKFRLLSVANGEEWQQVSIDYADCGFNGLHRIYKVEIDLSHLNEYCGDEYILECCYSSQRFIAYMEESVEGVDCESTIKPEADKEICLGIERDENGQVLIRIGKKKKLFSIIMAVYNVEPYIDEAVDSIINQDIGFYKNVELILVNDGSTDQSGMICRRYAEEYPDNIIYLEKENGGQSSARNLGLDYASAEYVNFCDPDDTLALNVLSEVYKFFEQNKNYIDMVSIPLVYFEGQTGLHGKYVLLGGKNKIVNLAKEPFNFVLSAASSFYKREICEKIRFDVRMTTAEDARINVQIIRHTLRFGYVCENGVKYNYRRRNNGGSNTDLVSSGDNYESLIAPIYLFDDLFENKKVLVPYEKELIAYEIRGRLKTLKKESLKESEYQTIIQSYKKWIKRLDDEFIANSKWLDIIEKKVLFLNLSDRSFGEWVRRGYSELSDRVIKVQNFYVEDGYLRIDCLYFNFMESEIKLVLLSSNRKNEVIYPNDALDIDGPYNLMIGEFCADITHVRYFRVPLENSEYSFAYYDAVENCFIPIRRVQINGKARCAANVKGVGILRNGYCISLWGSHVLITDNSNYTSSVTKTLEKNIGKELPLRQLAKDQKKYILIFDRPEKAGDNGEALFEYIMENELQEIKEVTFFVINKNSKDYTAIKYKEHVVDFRSIEHLYLFLNAKVIYSSHNAVLFFYPFSVDEYKYYADLLDYKFVWLQHGVIENDVAKAANKLNTHDDIVVTSSYKENNELSKPSYLYQNGEVILTGLARFDKLFDKKKKIITIAPTWRQYLVGKILPNGHNEPKPYFEQSNYYINYIDLLTDTRLAESLNEYGYQVEFVLHSGFSCYEGLFELINSEHVRLVDMDDFSYRDAFCKSSLFVTDYSSTAFDFAYLKKPVIYFQFDEKEFFSEHYGKGAFGYREDGFGPVLETVEEVVDQIILYLRNGCEMENMYKERVDKTFAYHDRNNCKRIMDATRKFLL